MNRSKLAALAIVCAASSVASAAGILDLTAAGSSGTIAINGTQNAIFSTSVQQPTGTGVIQPFVRIQGNGTESGYNTDGTIQFDTKDTNNWTHSITCADVAIVTINGVQYREFFLDINEAGNDANKLLSMDKLQVFLGDGPSLTNYPGFDGHATKIYDMDLGPTGDRYVQMDYRNANGSGSGDLNVYIPNSLFTGPNQYIYLYSSFGTPSSSNAGFEEWSSRTGTTPPPPPPPPVPTPAAFGGGLVGLAILLGKRFRNRPE